MRISKMRELLFRGILPSQYRVLESPDTNWKQNTENSQRIDEHHDGRANVLLSWKPQPQGLINSQSFKSRVLDLGKSILVRAIRRCVVDPMR